MSPLPFVLTHRFYCCYPASARLVLRSIDLSFWKNKRLLKKPSNGSQPRRKVMKYFVTK
jgi:hypothetical protein